MAIKRRKTNPDLYQGQRRSEMIAADRTNCYNCFVDDIRQAIRVLITTSPPDNIGHNTIEIDGAYYLALILYKEDCGVNVYQIELTRSGELIEGYDRVYHGMFRAFQRHIVLRYICQADEVAYHDCCFSQTGLLDFNTLKTLRDKLLGFPGIKNHEMLAEMP